MWTVIWPSKRSQRKSTHKQKYKHEENPLVIKTGVNAVHKKLPTEEQQLKDCNL